MEAQELVDALTRRGYKVRKPAISHDGYPLLNVDGRLMKFDEAKEAT